MTKDAKTNKILLPFSWIYGLITDFRNKLFDWGWLNSAKFSVPIISVGNLSVGGTGKTPHVESIIKLLLHKDLKVAVLSRGYKRKTKGFTVACEGSTALSLGDESFQIHRKFPEVVVAVDNDRVRGINKLLELPSFMRPDVIVLDDAFQHRHVLPSLQIVLTDYHNLYYKDCMLPAGRLREYASNIKRTQMVVVTKCPLDMKPIDYRIIATNMDLFPYQDLFFTTLKYKSLLPAFPDTTSIKKEDMNRLKKEGYSFLLVTGIAKPTTIKEYLGSFTKHLEHLNYPDHHNFEQKDIREITSRFEKISGEKKLIITTEKDMTRLIGNKNIPESIKPFIFYLPIEIAFMSEEEDNLFNTKIEQHVNEFTRNSSLPSK